jgi:hypothetical protein
MLEIVQWAIRGITAESKMSTEGGLQVLDGSQIRSALPELKTKESFTKHDEGSKGYLTPSEVRRAAEAEAAALLLGVRLSAQILDNAVSIFPTEDSANVPEEAFAATLQSYLTAIADALEGTFLELEQTSCCLPIYAAQKFREFIG